MSESSKSIEDLPRTGATYMGRPVTRIVIFTDDGLRHSHELPKPEGSERLKQRIMQVLLASDVPLTRKQIAKRLGLKGIGGRFSTTTSEMIAEKLIHELDGELTDSPDKGYAGSL